MTRRRQVLLDDASAAGYDVVFDGPTIFITKGSGRHIRGLVIYEDGTDFDISVPHHVAKGIRSYFVMRGILGIREESRC